MDSKVIQKYSSAGQHKECLQACQQLLQSEPKNAFAWKFAGKSLLALRQLQEAQQYLLKAHQLDTVDPETATDIGNIFLELGNRGDAAKWYAKALEIDGSFAPGINNVANIKRHNGSNKEAADLYKRAIEADPQLFQAYVGGAASFLELGDLDQAETLAIQAIGINESVPVINEILGIIYQKKGSHEKAIEHHRKELAINPKNSNSLLNLGLLLLQKGQTAEAIEPLVKASSIKPSTQCSLLLAQAYQ